MTTTQTSPLTVLQPVAEELNLLAPAAEGGCCGGGSCSV